MEELKFSLKLKEIPVNITDVDGQEKSYTLRELTGAQRDTFLDEMGSRLKYAGGKIQGLTNYKGLQASLVSLCLHDDKGNSIKKEIIQSYPASVLSDLFDAAQDLSGLVVGEEELEKLKNA